ncbi:MAG: amidophosphoribosyltransferase [Planctomycetota bacterium]
MVKPAIRVALPQFPAFAGRGTVRARREAEEKCGVFGCWGIASPATLTYLGLYSLQHRGQESAGIAVTDGRGVDRHVGMGLVPNVFDQGTLTRLNRHAHDRQAEGYRPPGGAVGHNRYSTTGGSQIANAQPMLSQIGLDDRGATPVAIAHNGNIVNAASLRRDLEQQGHPFTTNSDTEVVLHLLAAAAAQLGHTATSDPLSTALRHCTGAFTLVLLFPDRIEAARDPWGWRPLVIGRTEEGGFIVASETVALEVAGASLVREVLPGEIVTIDDSGMHSRFFSSGEHTPAHCIFEHVYLASPASRVFGKTVQLSREATGAQLAKESPVEADWIIPMPDSGRSAAMGFSRASGIPIREGIIPNRYVGRSFIKPTGDQRAAAVRLKLNVIEEAISGQRIIVVDDSIVRGTTTRTKMQQLRARGAREIHLRIASPPITHPCFFGIDFASPDELIARGRSEEQIAAELGVESVRYLSLDGLKQVVADEAHPEDHYCAACFTGKYPVSIAGATARDALGC